MGWWRDFTDWVIGYKPRPIEWIPPPLPQQPAEWKIQILADRGEINKAIAYGWEPFSICSATVPDGVQMFVGLRKRA